MKIKFFNGEKVECTNFNEQSVMNSGKIFKWIATFVLKGVDADKVSKMVDIGLFTSSFELLSDNDELISVVDKYNLMTSAFLRYRDEGVFTEIQLTKEVSGYEDI